MGGKAGRSGIEVGTDAAIDAARQNAANRTAGMIRDHNRQAFDSFKRQAEGVFDALLTKSQSIWSAIGNSFKTALLTAIKDVVSSRVAAMLMQLFTGQKVSFASGGSGGGGVLGSLGGMLGVGAIPVFGAGGGGFGGGGPIPTAELVDRHVRTPSATVLIIRHDGEHVTWCDLRDGDVADSVGHLLSAPRLSR